MQPSDGTTPDDRRTVVIADDDASARTLVRLVLETGGYEVVAEAVDGADALAKISIHRPDIVVLDEEMPHMTGSQAARLIRIADPGVRIVRCSNSDRVPLQTDGFGADAHISKEDVAYLPLTLDRVAG